VQELSYINTGKVLKQDCFVHCCRNLLLQK